MSAAGQEERSGLARTHQRPVGPWNPDWLRTSLTVSGPAAEVARFRDAARGTGAVPWHLDLDHEEARLLAPMAAAGLEARLLARELRDIIAARHERILAHLVTARPMPARPAPADPRAGRDAATRRGLPHRASLAPAALGHHPAAAAGSDHRQRHRPPAAPLGPHHIRVSLRRLDPMASDRPTPARFSAIDLRRPAAL